MKKMITILTIMSLLLTDAFARAGSSYSRSSGSSSHSNTGTKANYSKPTKQYSSNYVAPTPKPSPSVTPTPHTATPSSTHTSPTVSSPGSTPSTHTSTSSTTIVHSSTPSGGGGSGMGIIGTMAGVAGGIVAGNLLTNALTGNHASQPMYNGQPVSYQNGQPMIQDSSGVMQAVPQGAIIQQAPSDTSFWGIIFTMLWYIILITAIYFIGRWVYRYFKYRKTSMNPIERDKAIPIFENNFILIQKTANSKLTIDKELLGSLVTSEMYDFFNKCRSENLEADVVSITTDIVIKDITTTNYEQDESTGDIYHSVKINANMIDYVIDTSEKVVEGSKDIPINVIEIWTFVSKDHGKHWKLSAIEQYEK